MVTGAAWLGFKGSKDPRLTQMVCLGFRGQTFSMLEDCKGVKVVSGFSVSLWRGDGSEENRTR